MSEWDICSFYGLYPQTDWSRGFDRAGRQRQSWVFVEDFITAMGCSWCGAALTPVLLLPLRQTDTRREGLRATGEVIAWKVNALLKGYIYCARVMHHIVLWYKTKTQDGCTCLLHVLLKHHAWMFDIFLLSWTFLMRTISFTRTQFKNKHVTCENVTCNKRISMEKVPASKYKKGTEAITLIHTDRWQAQCSTRYLNTRDRPATYKPTQMPQQTHYKINSHTLRVMFVVEDRGLQPSLAVWVPPRSPLKA